MQARLTVDASENAKADEVVANRLRRDALTLLMADEDFTEAQRTKLAAEWNGKIEKEIRRREVVEAAKAAAKAATSTISTSPGPPVAAAPATIAPVTSAPDSTNDAPPADPIADAAAPEEVASENDDD